MNTYQLIKEIDKIEEKFLAKKMFFNALTTYVDNYQTFIASFCGTANLPDNSQLAAKNNEARKTISTPIKSFKKVIQPSQFFEDVADIKTTLKKIVYFLLKFEGYKSIPFLSAAFKRNGISNVAPGISINGTPIPKILNILAQKGIY